MIEIIAEAFGRVNLIGEHTDYNGGFVLPTAIPQKTVVRIVRTDRGPVRATTAASFAKVQSTLEYRLGEEKPTGSWIDYIQGATFLLRQMGHKIGSFDLTINSNIPTGSGLSSSAALEISFLKALTCAFELGLTEVEMAQLGQKIENKFVGANVGIMDQMACAFAKFGEALYLDTKNLSYKSVKLPLEKMDLVVINSGVEHQHAGGDYNQRRQECESACEKLGIKELRELTENDLAKLEFLPDVLRRRARHVLTENARVHRAVGAIEESDPIRLGELFYESHVSMRDDYKVSVPEIDKLVELCRKNPSAYGARLTGGGFGGSIVAIAKKGEGEKLAREVCDEYQKLSPVQPTILVPSPESSGGT